MEDNEKRIRSGKEVILKPKEGVLDTKEKMGYALYKMYLLNLLKMSKNLKEKASCNILDQWQWQLKSKDYETFSRIDFESLSEKITRQIVFIRLYNLENDWEEILFVQQKIEEMKEKLNPLDERSENMESGMMIGDLEYKLGRYDSFKSCVKNGRKELSEAEYRVFFKDRTVEEISKRYELIEEIRAESARIKRKTEELKEKRENSEKLMVLASKNDVWPEDVAQSKDDVRISELYQER
jgi:hypothetical protein